MTKLQTLCRGLLAAAGVIIAALWAALAVSPEWLTGWGTVILVAMVPAQIVISLVWQSAWPRRLTELPQPWRGLAFTALNAAVGGLVALIAWQTVGGGLGEATPFLIMYLILAVPVVLLLVIPLQGWPFAGWVKHPGALGAALVAASYGIAWLLFRWLFNFEFMAGAPVYRAELDPQGLLMAWVPLVFSIALVVPVLSLVLFDFWPLGRLAGRQPAFGLAALALCVAVAAALWQVFVVGQGMDVVLFMVRICIAVNFGYFILLVMLEGVPALTLPQPWRGLVLNAVALLLAVALLKLYEALALGAFALASGAPAYPLELWLASAMLSVTFPLMVVVGSYFQFWPLSRAGARATAEAAVAQSEA